MLCFVNFFSPTISTDYKMQQILLFFGNGQRTPIVKFTSFSLLIYEKGETNQLLTKSNSRAIFYCHFTVFLFPTISIQMCFSFQPYLSNQCELNAVEWVINYTKVVHIQVCIVMNRRVGTGPSAFFGS